MDGDHTLARKIGDLIIKANITAQFLPDVLLIPKFALSAKEMYNNLEEIYKKRKERRAKV